MKNQIDYSGFIERYLNQTMKPDELKWFREEINLNQDLAGEVQMQKDIGEAILNEETLELRAQISSLFEKQENAQPVKKKKRAAISHAFRLAVASVTALLVLGSGFYLYSHRTIPAERLFENYYEPYKGLMNVRSGNSQVADMLLMAMQKYEQKQYESALLLFETVLASDSENITSRFYSGISYLETERYGTAQKSFTGVIDHDDNMYIEHAEWYLGLCYLKTGEEEQARKLFRAIAGSDGFYSKTARRLTRNL